RIGLLVSNPPYVAEPEVPNLPSEVADWEPVTALVAGPTGLEALAHIISEAPAWLRRPGILVLELAPHQAEEVARLAQAAGFTSAVVEADLAGRLRCLVARYGAD